MLLLLIVAIALLAGYIPVPAGWEMTTQAIAVCVLLYWAAWIVVAAVTVLIAAVDKVWRR